MMPYKKIKIYIIIALILILFSPLLGFAYSRNPPDFTLYNPVSFTIDNQDIIQNPCENPELTDDWLIGIGVYHKIAENTAEELVFGLTRWGDFQAPYTITENLPIGDYFLVEMGIIPPDYNPDDPFGNGGCFAVLEGNPAFDINNPNDRIFEVVNLIGLNNIFLSSINYTAIIFKDLLPFILLILGIPLAIWLIVIFSNFIRKYARK